MKKGLISVIVPVYNTESYLERCIGSIVSQTYKELEILLVDDGSTDGSGGLCDEWAQRDGRIRVLHKENGGSSSARNMGLAAAAGEYIGFVDSDDYLDKGMYERLYKALADRDRDKGRDGDEAGSENGDIYIAQIGRDEIDEQGRRLEDICIPPEQPIVIPAAAFMRELIMHRGDASFCTKLLPACLFREKGFPEGRLNEDFWLLIELLQRISGVISLPERGYHVYYRLGSNTRKKDPNSFSRVYSDCVDNADLVYELVREKYPALYHEALRFGVYQRLEYLLHIPVGQMNRENGRYREIVSWMRRNYMKGLANPCLTIKNKIYHTLFILMPRGIRVLHQKVKRV